MMLQNHPTFFILLFAISKIGAVPSLLNTNLSDNSLLHCIRLTDTKLFLFDSTYESQVATIIDSLRELNINLYCYGESTESTEAPPLAFATTITPSTLSNYSDKDTSDEYIKNAGKSDPAYLIYTR